MLSQHLQKWPQPDPVGKMIAIMLTWFSCSRTKCYLAQKNTLNTRKKAIRKPVKQVKKITLTIRAWTQAEVDLLILTKKVTGEANFSKALMTAAKRFEEMQKVAESRYAMITKLQQQMRHSDEVLKFMSSSNKMLDAYSKKYLGKYPEPTLPGF